MALIFIHFKFNFMFIRVNHNISNPQEFWGRAQKALPNLPAGIKLHASYPNDTMNDATCIWEAADIKTLTDYLEPAVGDVSKNAYMAINATNAMGLPTAATN